MLDDQLNQAVLVHSESRVAGSEPFSSYLFASLRQAAAVVRVWLRRSRSRRQLVELGDQELSDLGISRAQARFESEKPFWWH